MLRYLEELGLVVPKRTPAGYRVYGLPELHRAELAALRHADQAIVGSPGCYPTATLLALAPLARAGLIGDLVVDAKSGVSGAGREAKPDLMFGEVNESVKAYGIGGHRHVAEIEQELAGLGAGASVANPGAFTPGFRTLYGDAEGELDRLDFVPWGHLDRFFEAVVQATEEAVVNALIANEDMVGYRGHRTPSLPRDRVVELLKATGRIG